MFCSNCGNPVADNANFCMYCGTKLAKISAVVLAPTNQEILMDTNECKAMALEPISFSIQGNTLSFDSCIAEYTNLRKNFLSNFFNHCTEAIKKIKAQQVSNLDDYLDIYCTYGLGVIDWLYDEALHLLLGHNIYDIAKNQIINEYNPEESEFLDAYAEFEDKYASIVASAQELENYRELRKASRGRWIGGGFGVSGAVKGAITAGALNLGSDMIHGIGDVFRSASDNAKITRQKEELLKINWLSIFSVRLLIDASEIFDVAIDILDDRGVIEKPQLHVDQANAYYENSCRLSEEKEQIRLAAKAIELSPYDERYYLRLSHLIGVYNCDFIAIAEYFLPDAFLYEIAKDEHNLYSGSFKTKDGYSQQELDRLLSVFKKRFQSIKSLHQSSPDSTIIEFYVKKLYPKEKAFYQDFFEKRCTSEDGLKFDSIEALNQYNNDIKIFKSYDSKRAAAWDLKAQLQLLGDLEKEVITSPPVVEHIDSWKKYLEEMQRYNEAYKLSIHYYLQCTFSDESTAHAEEIKPKLEKYLSKTKFAPIQEILFIQELPYAPSFFSDKKQLCWLVVTDYSIILIKDNQIVLDVEVSDLKFIHFTSMSLCLQSGTTKVEIKLYNDSESNDFSKKRLYMTTEETINSALKQAHENHDNKLCPHCRSSLYPGSLFCGDCGFRL